MLGDPNFLRAVVGITVPGPRQLLLTGTDIARNADGSWQVLADRAGAPVGAGFAMQDRRIIAEVLSGLYRHARIRRVGQFFSALRRAIGSLAPAASTSVRTVLLAPGADHPAAFDHAYLATMLGFPLVEGEDLVVVDGRVWLRSLENLEPVDVVLRAIPGGDCDPLDLRGDSTLGVPGLVEAARNGAVTIANPIGSGALDNPGLLTYLPRLARTVLGEELLIPSTVTYWCGERSMCSHVIANLDRLVVRSTQPRSRAIRGWELTIAQRADLAVRIAAEPTHWAGQERVAASTTPTVEGTTLVARETHLRTFAVADGEDYQVMSGGLARVPVAGGDVIDPDLTDQAKDVWVLSSLPYATGEPWLGEDPVTTPAQLPSSISPGAAEDLFWLGRWTERAESGARLVRAVGDRWNDFAAAADGDQFGPDASPSDGVGALIALTEALAEVLGGDTLAGNLLDDSIPGSVSNAVGALTRRADSVRDQLPRDVWGALSSIDRVLAVAKRRLVRESGEIPDVVPSTTRLIDDLLAVSGIVAESMERDIGWSLLEAGRRLERAQRLVDVLAATITRERAAAIDSLILETVLIANESVMTYRRRYQSRASIRTVLDLLLLDAGNPRSLRFQVAELTRALARVPAQSRSIAARDGLIADLGDMIAEIDTTALARVDEAGERAELRELLRGLGWRLQELSAEVARAHFFHAVPVPWLDASGTFAPVAGVPAGPGRSGDPADPAERAEPVESGPAKVASQELGAKRWGFAKVDER